MIHPACYRLWPWLDAAQTGLRSIPLPVREPVLLPARRTVTPGTW